VRGPVPADGFFADVARGVKPPDGVLAMHHDQGLAPYKLLVGGEGINVTWGLRAPRTSPDHGTAYALAGKNKASAASMIAAIELCARLAKSQGAPLATDMNASQSTRVIGVAAKATRQKKSSP
jgi:4-hydroxythreonine-4-phosphate dehydrogenase